MESIVRNVRDIEAGDRHALEHVVGRQLRDNQRLIIQLAEIEIPAVAPPADSHDPQRLPEWCKVYDGLSEADIAEIEQIALQPVSFGRASN